MEGRSQIKSDLLKTVMLGSFAFGIMPFILPIYSKTIGGNAMAIGGLFSVFSVVSILFRPFVGRGLDRFGRKKFLVIAFFIYAISMLLFSYSTSLALLYVSRVVQAVGASFMWISAYSITMDITEQKKRGEAIGSVDGASSRGALYGAIIGFVLLSQMALMSGWNLLFKGFAILSVIAGVLAYRYIPETKKQLGAEYTQQTSVISRDFRKLLSVVFITALSTSMLSPILMIYLQDRFSENIGTLATAYIPAALVYVLLPSRLGSFSDKYGRIIPMVIGLIGSGIVSLGLPHSESITVLALLWVLESIGIAMASPAEEALVADIAGNDIRGAAYGWYLFASSLGASLGPLIGGWLYDSYGHVVPFELNGVILLVNGWLVMILFRKTKWYKTSTEW